LLRSRYFAPCRSRIAPRSTLQSLTPLSDCSVSDAQCATPYSDFSSLDALHRCILRGLLRFRCLTIPCRSTACAVRKHFTSRSLHGFLRARRFCSAPLQIALYPTLDASLVRGYLHDPFPHPAPLPDASVNSTQELCIESAAPRPRHLSLRTVCGLLPIRRLALYSDLQIAPHSSLSALY